MTRASRCLVAVLSLVFGALFISSGLPVRATERAPLERGTAIIEPFALRELDHGRFALVRILAPSRAAGTPLDGDALFALPSMVPVRKALDQDYDRYVEQHKATLPNESIGVGTDFAFQLFDRALLYSAGARFVLSGIVNRMDRAYVPGPDCGEIRLLYRLTQPNKAEIGENAVSPRLPMTLNVILKARGERAVDVEGKPWSCAEIARRWLAAGDLTETGAALADRLTGKGGPLEAIAPGDVFRIETNMQIAHAPKSAMRDFRTDYMMKVFDFDATSAAFEEATLENQIDRERLLADDAFRADFKAWLLEPAHFAELDRGTILIPDRFLARVAIAPTPIGFAPSNLQPAFGLVQGQDGADKPVFTQDDVVTALKQAGDHGVTPQNILSPAGFERRLNDIGCAGCHQNRGIGGFHFPGVDWMAAKPSNSTVVPASPHFFGDQVRRRDILTAFSEDRKPDFSRGFASRPQTRGSTELAGTEYEDGWGAHCYTQHDDEAENDRSFRSWTCAEGLSCQVAGRATRMGMCFIKTR
jgi:hypothetical protein